MRKDRTGVEGLDIITHGGLPSHGITAILGPPGAGKSVLMMQAASAAIAQGRHVVVLSVFSEPIEKLVEHMSGFPWFNRDAIGEQMELLSMRSVVREGADATMTQMRQLLANHKDRRPLLILDGYRGLRNVMGAKESQELLASLSSWVPYMSASGLISVETGVTHEEEVAELASVDAIIELCMARWGANLRRTLEVRKLRGSNFRRGQHSMTITEEGVTVFPRLATVLPADEPELTGRRMSFGLSELDAMMRGGIPEFSVTLISGPSGSGKTTVGVHWLLNGVQAGDRGIIVSFRESVADLDAKTRGIGIPGFMESIERGDLHVMRVPPTEVDPDIVAHDLTQMLSRDARIKRVVIDGAVELEQATRDPGWQHDYLGALAEYLWRSRTTLLLLRERADRGISVAQNRIELRRVEYQGQLHRIVGIVTMQASDHDTTLREFHIGTRGVYILPENESAEGVLRGIAAEHPFDGQ